MRLRTGVIRGLFVLLVVSIAAPAGAQLAGTLNFVDETASRIMPTIAEAPGNEKEIELGDFDNDGDLDVVIAVGLGAFTNRVNKLYRNDGGVFVEISGSPAVPGFSAADLSRNAFLRDYDGDGWLDIIIINDSLAFGQAGTTKYYANVHPGDVFSHFEEQTFRLNGAGGAACGGVSLDFNDDGFVDLYLGNYPEPSQDTLYLNDGSGVFTNVTASSVPLDGDYTTDIASADINGDLLPDVLVSNHFDPNFVYYNDGLGAGDGPGDLKYPGSTQQLSGGASVSTAMEPGDFDGDGMQDVYYSNRTGNVDVVLHNQGNNANGVAQFAPVDLPTPVSQFESKKATVTDLNGDGRLDVIVMFPSRRPAILRNTSVGGTISFVDWTPSPAFPAGAELAGWHAATLDMNGDERPDLLLGGDSGEHALINTPSPNVSEEALGGVLPSLFNQMPIAIRGEGQSGDTDVFSAFGIPAGETLSTVLRGCGDFLLEVRDSGGVVATSDRGTIGVEEAMQIAAPGGTLSLDVTVVQACGDADGDGSLTLADADLFRACGQGPATGACRIFDFDFDGEVGAADFQAFRSRALAGGAASSLYVLEVLARER